MGWNLLLDHSQTSNGYTVGSLRMGKWFHLILSNWYNYLSMPGVKLFHISKRRHDILHYVVYIFKIFILLNFSVAVIVCAPVPVRLKWNLTAISLPAAYKFSRWKRLFKLSFAVSLKYMDGSVQERCNSSALAMELRLSCTNLLICCVVVDK